MVLALRGGGTSKDSKSKVICSGLTSGGSMFAVAEDAGLAGVMAALVELLLDRLCGPRFFENIRALPRYTCTMRRRDASSRLNRAVDTNTVRVLSVDAGVASAHTLSRVQWVEGWQ